MEATYTTPYLPRARMEPGNATVLVTDDRVDIWISNPGPAGDALLGRQKSPAFRKPTSICTLPPRRRLRPQRQRPAGRTGDLYRQPAPRHAHPPAVDARGGFIGSTYRAMGVARLRAALDADGFPVALEVRTAMDETAPEANASFDRASVYFAPSYRFSNHFANFHVPSAHGTASAPRRTTSTARAFWTNSPTLRARTPTSTAAS